MAQPFEPTPAEVKALMPARVDGQPFSTDTTPRVSEVQLIIEDVATEVAAHFDDAIPEDLHGLAKAVVKEGAARDIERGFFPEQHDDTTRATHARYSDRYDRLLELLKARMASSVAEDSDIVSGRLTGGVKIYE
jgi:hypothetical protein